MKVSDLMRRLGNMPEDAEVKINVYGDEWREVIDVENARSIPREVYLLLAEE